METIRCERVSIAFGGTRALYNLALDFPPSGITALIGPNGAGKTTLLNVLTGFLQPDSGDCFLGHTRISGRAPHEIVQLGIARTFQDLRLIKQITTLENVLLACPNQKGERLFHALMPFRFKDEEARNRELALNFLGLVGLKSKADEPAGELSYGQQKLLSIACCLATGARILLLDEPIAGVHPEMASSILNTLGQLRDQDKLIVFIEHNLSAVRQVADNVFVMSKGAVILHGSPEVILEEAELMKVYLA